MSLRLLVGAFGRSGLASAAEAEAMSLEDALSYNVTLHRHAEDERIAYEKQAKRRR